MTVACFAIAFCFLYLANNGLRFTYLFALLIFAALAPWQGSRQSV